MSKYVLRANVRTPWASAGQTFEVDSLSPLMEHHLDNLVLTDVTPPKPKKAAKKAVVVEESPDA